MNITAGITFLKVEDIQRSHTFYGEGLGLEMVIDQGQCRIYRLTESSYVGVCERPESGSSNVVVTIVTDDVADWHDRFVTAGAETDGEPRENSEYRIYHFFATDPDGHVLEVQRFWDVDWAEPMRI